MNKVIWSVLAALLFITSPVFGASDTEKDFKVAQNFSVGAGTVTDKILWGFDTVANGQTSKAVTLAGVTTSSRCLAAIQEVATNSVAVRAVVPTTNTVTVTISGDPGASAADIAVWCVE